MNRKNVVRLIAVGILLFVLLVWGLVLKPTSQGIPSFAAVEAIERNYEPQVHRLLELVQHSQLVPRIIFNDPTDVKLFSAPEILEAKIESTPHSGRLLGSKEYNFKSRVYIFPREPSIGIAVVNRYWDTQANGNKRTVLEYQRRIRDDKGNEVGVILLFDFSALEKKAANHLPDKALQTNTASPQRFPIAQEQGKPTK